VLDGTWEQSATWAGMAEGNVVMAPYTNMPDDVKAMAEETEAKITSGEFHPFTGPIMKQDGSEWLADGVVPDDLELSKMNFYVKGIDDQLPQ
jgi:basic membrane protein A